MKVILTELLGKISSDYPAQGNPYNILPPSERDIWGVRTVYWYVYMYVCLLTYPLRFIPWGTREMFFRDARDSYAVGFAVSWK